MRWLIWSGLLLIWTIAVEFPGRSPEEHPDPEVLRILKQIAAKTMHIGVYAFLTGLSPWAPLPVRFRWVMMFVLIGHAWLTEWLQELLSPIWFRHGSLADVGFDLLGIAMGATLTWRSWAGVAGANSQAGTSSDPAPPRDR